MTDLFKCFTCDAEFITTDELVSHLTNDCKSRDTSINHKRECALCQGEPGPTKHPAKNKYSKCRYCDLYDCCHDSHALRCDAPPVECPDCKEDYPKYSTHNCKARKVKIKPVYYHCPFVNAGCNVKLRDYEIDRHVRVDAVRHSRLILQTFPAIFHSSPSEVSDDESEIRI